MTEAVGEHIDDRAILGELAASRDQRIDRIAGGRREHEARRLLLVHPFVGAFGVAHGERLVERFEQAMMSAIVALECVDRAGEIGEALQVLAVLEVVAAHRGRKAQHFRALVRAQQRDDLVQPLDDVLEHFTAAIQAVLAGLDQDAGFDQPRAQRRIGLLGGRFLRVRVLFGRHHDGLFRRHVHF